MDTMLDANGMILAEYLKPTHEVPAGKEGNNGAELQYLAPFQPFPYGLSPLALGYNYHKQAQILQRVSKQKHLQLSEQVIDNQPALALRMWAEEEWDRGRRLEQRGFAAIAGTTDATPRELRTAALAADAKIVDRAAIDEAIFSYLRAAKAAHEGLPEVAQHIDRYPSKLQNYYMHSDTLASIEHLMLADGHYLQAIAAAPEQRTALLEQAKADYVEAWRWYALMILKYYVDEPDAVALKYSIPTVSEKSVPELRDLLARAMLHIAKTYKSVANSPHGSDIQEYDENIRRIDQRLALIK
jgi:hypothetical protein